MHSTHITTRLVLVFHVAITRRELLRHETFVRMHVCTFVCMDEEEEEEGTSSLLNEAVDVRGGVN